MNIKASSRSKNKVMILGGCGNFGRRISIALAKASVDIIIAGRDKDKALELAKLLKAEYQIDATAVFCDIAVNFEKALSATERQVVINTCGPFQNSDYSVPNLCIQHKVRYIDLADSRDFVCKITTLKESL